MGVLEPTTKQKIYTSTFIAILLIGALVYTGLMIWHASHLAGQLTVARSQLVSLGPLQLTELSKAPIAGGYTVRIHLLSGLAVYLLLWTVLAGLLTWLRLHRAGQHG